MNIVIIFIVFIAYLPTKWKDIEDDKKMTIAGIFKNSFEELLEYQDFFTLRRATELGKSGKSIRIVITHLIKKTYPISDIDSLHKKLKQIESKIIKNLHFDFDFKYSITTYLSPIKISFVIYFKINKIKTPRDPFLSSEFEKTVEESLSNSKFEIISYTQPFNAIQIEFKCNFSLHPEFSELIFKDQFFYSFHKLKDKFKFKYSKIKEYISENSICLVYRINLKRKKYSIFEFGICKESKHLLKKYLTMLLEASKDIEKFHHHSSYYVYFECDSSKIRRFPLRWLFNSIDNYDGWNPLIFLGKDKELLSKDDLWIPRKKELEQILFGIIKEKYEYVKYSRYQNWRKEHKISIKCEELNLLAYLMKENYSLWWDKRKKKWVPIAKQVFKINDYLTLKLESNQTNIYIKRKLFTKCKYLLFSFIKDELPEYEEINSIDEIKHKYDRSHEANHVKIPPEGEFWGHCSNLQAWYENDYNTRLLHSNIAFPLLKKLTECRDPLAQKVFKEEIALRFESNFKNVIVFLLNEKYLSFLDLDEIETLSNSINFSKWEIPMINSFFEQWYVKTSKNSNPKKIYELTKKFGVTGLNKISQFFENAKISRKEFVKSQIKEVDGIES